MVGRHLLDGSRLGGGSLDEIWNTNYTSGLYFQKMLGKHTIKAGDEIGATTATRKRVETSM